MMPKASFDSKHSEPPCIVLVTGSLQGGGAERVMADIANYWDSKGWRVVLATWSSPDVADFYKINTGVERVWLDVGRSRKSYIQKIKTNILRIVKLRKLLSSLEPNAVLSFIHIPNLLTILACIGLKVRIVVSERMQPAVDPTISVGWRVLRKILYLFSDEVVVQTEDAAHWVRRCCHKKAIVIPNALRSLPQIMEGKRKLIVAVGRLSYQKGFDLLLKAFAQIANDFEDWNVAIVGDGAEKWKLLRLRDELKLTKRVELVGQVQDVESWMARAGIVVQPSRFEGFPNVLLEAMGMGAAVISADCPSGPSDLIHDCINGRLVPVEDIEVLSQVMAELIAQPEIRKKLGHEAEEVREGYRQDLIMAQWESCLLPSN